MPKICSNCDTNNKVFAVCEDCSEEATIRASTAKKRKEKKVLFCVECATMHPKIRATRNHVMVITQPVVRKPKKLLCEHGRSKYTCSECPRATGICIHRKRFCCCVECGFGKSAGICEHRRQKRYCKECKGGELCEHLVHKYRCTTCVEARKRQREEFAGVIS